jgi:hypothetical protein
VLGDFFSCYQNAALIFSTKELGHEGIKSAAQCGLASPFVPHDYNKGSVFNLCLNILQGGSFVPLIGKRQIFN